MLAVNYRRALALFAVIAFFTGLADYLLPFLGFPPLYWIVALAVLALPLVFTPRTLSGVLESPVTRWCGFYAGFTILAFMWSSQSATAGGELRVRMLAVLFLASLLLVFADSRVHRAAGITILGSVLVGVVLNVVDWARPLTFSPILGRAGGLYLNPNISAIALVLGMFMTVEIVPRALRPWFVCLVGVGVLLTFSRGGAAAWVVATALMVGLRAVRIGPMLRVAAGSALVVGGALVISGRWEAAWQLASVVSSDAWGRLRLGTEMVDPSAEVRLGAASLSLQMFLDRPLLGWGVGATAEWDWSESTHNIYLRHLAEYGFAGLAIVPMLVWALLWRGSARRVHVAVSLAGVVLVWGIFSHNLLDERHVLICIALVASSSSAVKRAARTASYPRTLGEGARADAEALP